MWLQNIYIYIYKSSKKVFIKKRNKHDYLKDDSEERFYSKMWLLFLREPQLPRPRSLSEDAGAPSRAPVRMDTVWEKWCCSMVDVEYSAARGWSNFCR